MRSMFLLSLWLGAILLVPSGAHLLEMPHKLAMDRASYFNAQQMYLGWALFGFPIAIKIIIDAALAYRLLRLDRASVYGALLSAVCVALGLIIFFVWVQPANVATSNWANQPYNWATLRTHWEYGHLAIALLTLAAFGGISYSATRVGWH